MRYLRRRQREERMMQNLSDAMAQSGREPHEPGLRAAYGSIPRTPLVLICCPMGKAINHGGLLRLAEAFRLEHVYFETESDNRYDLAGTTGAHFWQPYSLEPAIDAIRRVKASGHRAYCMSLDEDALPLQKVEWKFPAAIVLGEELTGVPDEVHELCDVTVAMPLYGLVTSLNVGQAAAIAVNDAVGAYAEQNPEFEPVRNASRLLLGLDTANYLSEPEETT